MRLKDQTDKDCLQMQQKNLNTILRGEISKEQKNTFIRELC